MVLDYKKRIISEKPFWMLPQQRMIMTRIYVVVGTQIFIIRRGSSEHMVRIIIQFHQIMIIQWIQLLQNWGFNSSFLVKLLNQFLNADIGM